MTFGSRHLEILGKDLGSFLFKKLDVRSIEKVNCFHKRVVLISVVLITKHYSFILPNLMLIMVLYKTILMLIYLLLHSKTTAYSDMDLQCGLKVFFLQRFQHPRVRTNPLFRSTESTPWDPPVWKFLPLTATVWSVCSQGEFPDTSTCKLFFSQQTEIYPSCVYLR